MVSGWLSSCSSVVSPDFYPHVEANPAVTETAVPFITPTVVNPSVSGVAKPALNSPTPKQTQIASPTQEDNIQKSPDPPELVVFTPDKMKLGVSPIPYLTDTCFYLDNRWGEGKSNPGTVVVPIMFHSVVKPGRVITDSTSISMEYFEHFMETAKKMGFSTITTEELVGFLEHNQAIPERSMLLILDDRRPGVTELFMDYLIENDWTLTLGWIATDTTRDSVWEQMTTMAETGRLDVQSHGYNHIYIQEYMTLEQIEEELYRSKEVIEARFGRSPIAYVWPGGNYTQSALVMADEAGYKIGFTAYSRGPILFNWIPLGQSEIAMNAPLMLLPRFWSTAAVQALEEAVMVSEAAKLAAEEVRDAELAYLSTYCPSLEGE